MQIPNTLYNLYSRWQDEHEYEDFKEYEKVMSKVFGSTVTGTKRPFGFKVTDGGVTYIVKLSLTRNSYKLVALEL